MPDISVLESDSDSEAVKEEEQETKVANENTANGASPERYELCLSITSTN